MSKNEIEEIEIIISKFLMIGVLLSAFVIFSGFIMFLVIGNSGYIDNIYPTNPIAILQGVVSFKPYAIILTGLLILIATPVFRVGISIIVFIKEKDYLYVKITSLVFIILIISFILGKVE